VFPVFEENQFQLRNSATIRNNGIEINLNANIWAGHDGFSYRPSVVFSSYETKVLKISENRSRLPISGFSTISKNLIEGQPAGVLVGSAFARNAEGAIIIDEEGFPLVANELQLIGDPTPDFNLGFQNTFSWKGFKLDFLFDYQRGGDVWNGTQNVLNYLGRSQQSALERSTTNFIFQGVTQEGIPNTTPVNFVNPNVGISGNRFARYGYQGVAEEAIVDGSYFNFRSFHFTYDFAHQKDQSFFREFKVSLYGKNIFTHVQYDGATPYSNFYDQDSGQGLQFFNTPITSEFGIQMNIKI